MGRTPENVNAHELYQELFRDKFIVDFRLEWIGSVEVGVEWVILCDMIFMARWFQPWADEGWLVGTWE